MPNSQDQVNALFGITQRQLLVPPQTLNVIPPNNNPADQQVDKTMQVVKNGYPKRNS